MFKLFNLKWKREFEQLKALHDIDLQKKDAGFDILKRELTQNLKLQEEALTQKHELALTEAISLLKLDYQQQLKQKEIDFERQLNDLKSKVAIDQANFQKEVQNDTYKRLTDAMTKLHEEGNITTQFTKDLALEIIKNKPTVKSEHKYITGDVSIDSK